ncbi:MAG TPA: hypothetical protein VGF69_24400 [Thermoanaerobaculia bacterium]|jgi:hypothetical protein
MVTPDEQFESTLIRRGVTAGTFREIEQFAQSLEDRPLDKLLSDLPGFARLSDTKFNLARQVLRRRVRTMPVVEREQLRLFAAEVASETDENVSGRIEAIFTEIV